MSGVGAGMGATTLPLTSSLQRQSLGQSPLSSSGVAMHGGINQGGLSIGSTMPANGASVYQSPYGLNASMGPSLGSPTSPPNTGSSPPPQIACSMGMTGMSMTMTDTGDMWRGTSIASLRRKALEHTASMSVFRWISTIGIQLMNQNKQTQCPKLTTIIPSHDVSFAQIMQPVPKICESPKLGDI